MILGTEEFCENRKWKVIQQTKDYMLTKYKLVHFFYYINVLSLLNGNYKILFLKNNFIKL